MIRGFAQSAKARIGIALPVLAALAGRLEREPLTADKNPRNNPDPSRLCPNFPL